MDNKKSPGGRKMKKGIDKTGNIVYHKSVGAAGDGCFLANGKR
jgi:hypothetical protein